MHIRKKVLLFFIITMLIQFPTFTNAQTVLNDDMSIVNKLKSLEILYGFQDKELDITKKITRAETAVLVSDMLGYSKGAFKEQTIFKDVKEDCFASGNINIVSNSGLMKGYLNGTFRPENLVSYDEAVSTIIKAIGYGEIAKEKSSYMKIATDNHITDGVTPPIIVSDEENGITFGDMLKLIYNSLDVDMMVQTGYGVNASYEIKKGFTILSNRFHIVKRNGQVTANSMTALNGEVNLATNFVEIDFVVYKCGNYNIDNLLGQFVEFYVKQEDNEDYATIVYIKPQNGKNNIVVVEAKDISDDTTVTQFKYFDQKEYLRKLSISKGVAVIYNYKAINPDFINNDLYKINNGKITLIDSNCDGSYDVIIIDSYKTYVVDRVRSTDQRIYFKYDALWEEKSYIEVNEKDNLEYQLLSSDIGKLSLNDVKYLDVLDIGISKNSVGTKIVTIIVSNNSEEGYIDEIMEDKGDLKLKLNDNWYTVNENYTIAQNINNQETKKFEVGMKIKFYLNFDKKISFVDFSLSDSFVYGYLIAAQIRKGISQGSKMKIYTQTGEIKIYSLKEKVDFYEDTYYGKLSDLECIKKYFVSNQIVPQLIKFKATLKDEIIQLQKFKDNSNLTDYDGYDTNIFTKDYVKTRGRLYNDLLDSKYPFVKNTIVFRIPADRNKDKLYSISRSFAWDEYIENFELYDVEEDYSAGVLLIDGSAKTTDLKYTQAGAVVEKIAQAVNEDGESVVRLYLYEKGSSITRDVNIEVSSIENDFWTYPQTNVTDLKAGDVIHYSTDKENQIINVRILFRGSEPKNFREIYRNGSGQNVLGNGKDDTLVEFWSSYGIVNKINKTVLVLNCTGDGTNKAFNKTFLMKSGSYTIYEKGKAKLIKATVNDITKEDKLFITTSWSGINIVLIVRD